MRYHEITTGVFPAILENINGIHDYSLYLDLLEAEYTGTKLVEELEQHTVQFLKNLKKLSVNSPQIGNVYSYIFLIFTSNDKLHVLGNQKSVELVKINNGAYTFADGKTYPDQRISTISASFLYVFDNTQNLNKVFNLLNLKFDTQIESLTV